MEKFSIYDLLALILPGALFVFFLSVFNKIFGIIQIDLNFSQWELIIGVYLCLIIIFGALLYIIGFWSKSSFFNKVFKFHIKVYNIYHCKTELCDTMSEVLNQKSQDWYNNVIFNKEDDFNNLCDDDKKKQSKLMDKFYDRMYYELEYLNLIDTPKTFQSFYLFFREIILASSILIVFGILLYLLVFIIWCFSLTQFISTPDIQNTVITFTVLLFFLISSTILARWYRKRMVLKMFWAYFTYLNLNNNNQ